MTYLDIFSKATWPVVTTFHVESPEAEETKLFKQSKSLAPHDHYAHTWYEPLKIFFSGTNGDMTLNQNM